MISMKLTDLLFRTDRRHDAHEGRQIVHEAREARAEALGILAEARRLRETVLALVTADDVAPLRPWEQREGDR